MSVYVQSSQVTSCGLVPTDLFSAIVFWVSIECSILFFRVRFHYGHPDIFDRIFHITRGGISKASKIINLSEDIFSGNLQSAKYSNWKSYSLVVNCVTLFRVQFYFARGLCNTSWIHPSWQRAWCWNESDICFWGKGCQWKWRADT